MLSPMHSDYLIDDINQRVQTDPEKLIQEAETEYHRQLNCAIREIGSRRIVCLAGPSGSGKTTTAHKLKAQLEQTGRDTIVLSMDDFYKHRSQMPVIDGKPNPEVLEALEVDLMNEKLQQLLTEGKADLPRYDFTNGSRQDDAVPTVLTADGCIIIEGIHGLNEAVSRKFPQNTLYKIYISPHSGFQKRNGVGIDKRQVRLIRRLVRDYNHRNSSTLRTMDMWIEVGTAEDLFIRPLARLADLRINTVHLYEPNVMRNEAIALLRQLPSDSKYREMAANLIFSLEQFLPLPVSVVPTGSLLQEFIGKPKK